MGARRIRRRHIFEQDFLRNSRDFEHYSDWIRNLLLQNTPQEPLIYICLPIPHHILRDLIPINLANHTLGTGFEFESGYGLFCLMKLFSTTSRIVEPRGGT